MSASNDEPGALAAREARLQEQVRLVENRRTELRRADQGQAIELESERSRTRTLEAENAQLRQTNRQFRADLLALQLQIEGLTEEKQALQRQHERETRNCEDNINSLNSEIIRQRKEMLDYESQIRALQHAVAQQTSVPRVSLTTPSSTTSDQLCTELNGPRERLERQSATLEATARQCKDLIDTNFELGQRLAKVDRGYITAPQTVVLLADQDSSRSEPSLLQQLETMRAELAHRNDEFQRSCQSLIDELHTYKTRSTDLDQENATLRATIAKTLETDKHRAEQQHAQAHNSRKQECIDTIASLTSELKQAKLQINAKDSEIDDLKKSVNALQQRASSLASLQTQLDTESAKCAVAQREVARLSSIVNDLNISISDEQIKTKSANGIAEDLAKTLQQLTVSKQAADKLAAALNAKADGLVREKNELSSQLSALQHENQQLAYSVNEASKEYTSLSNSSKRTESDLHAIIAGVRADLTAAFKQSHELREDKARLAEEILRIKSELLLVESRPVFASTTPQPVVVAQLDELKAKLQASESRAQRLEQQLLTAEADLNATQARQEAKASAAIQGEIEDLTANVERLRAKLARIDEEHAEVLEKEKTLTAKVKTDLEACRKEKETFELANARLEIRVKRLEQDVQDSRSGATVSTSSNNTEHATVLQLTSLSNQDDMSEQDTSLPLSPLTALKDWWNSKPAAIHTHQLHESLTQQPSAEQITLLLTQQAGYADKLASLLKDHKQPEVHLDESKPYDSYVVALLEAVKRALHVYRKERTLVLGILEDTDRSRLSDQTAHTSKLVRLAAAKHNLVVQVDRDLFACRAEVVGLKVEMDDKCKGLSEELANRKREVIKLNQDCNGLREQVGTKNKELAKMMTELGETLGHLNVSTERTKKLGDEIRALTDSLEQLKAKYVVMSQEYDESQAKVDELQQALKAAKDPPKKGGWFS